jgi:hypothetical protein
MSITNSDFIRNNINIDALFAESHGARNDFLGAGMLYYGLAYSMMAKNILVLGSEGAFTPRVFRQAQRDLESIEPDFSGATYLVDGNIGEYGRPNWNHENSFFRINYPEIFVYIETTDSTFEKFKDKKYFDIIFIDVDHSLKGVANDFNKYKNILSENGIILIHDTNGNLECSKIVDEIKKQNFEIVNFNKLYSGVAIVKYEN